MGSCCTKEPLPGSFKDDVKQPIHPPVSSRLATQTDEDEISVILNSKPRARGADYYSLMDDETPKVHLTHRGENQGSTVSVSFKTSVITDKKTQAPTASTSTSVANHLTGEVFAGQLVPTENMNQLHYKVANLLASTKVKVAKLEDIPEFAQLKLPDTPKSGPFKVKFSGSTYEGQVTDGVPHGLGKIVTSKGALIEGFFENGKLSKVVRFINVDTTGYTGGIEHKLKHGWGIYRDINGITIQANWNKGTTQGLIKILDSKGDVIFEGSSDKGVRSGTGKLVNKIEKYVYTGSFRNDLFDGFGTKKYFNGQVYEGHFKYGLEHGMGELRYIDGRILKIGFEYGHPRGIGTLITSDGVSKEITY